MTLYLRSQNKRSLLEAKSIICSNSGYILVNNINFGKYETEERCLEILDEIQKLITDSNKTIITSDIDMATYERLLCDLQNNNIGVLMPNDNTQVFPLNTNFVYQMPEK